jgi:hypothetical protein
MRAGIIEGETFPEPSLKLEIFKSLIALRISHSE